MKLLFFLVTLFVCVRSEELDYVLCVDDTTQSKVEIHSITLDPNPPVVKQKATFELKAHLKESVDKMKLRINGKMFLGKIPITIPQVEIDLCGKYINCPVPAGEFTLTESATVPSILSAGKKYSAQFTLLNEDEVLTCAEITSTVNQ